MELLAVAVIVVAVLVLAVKRGTVRYIFQVHAPGEYESYKHQLGIALLLGLELLVAADVVRTVALEPSWNNVAVLGLLVLIRTFLSWSLTVEIQGRWPWHTRSATDTQSVNAQVVTLAEDEGRNATREVESFLVN
jgi:uncharacterized membrane protein